MIRGLWTAATGMQGFQTSINVIANNLANVNTDGFKKNRVNFQDLMYQNLRMPGASTSTGARLPAGIQIGLGSQVVAVEKLFSQGDMTQTQNPLDLAIQGQGFFQLLSNGKQVYTRAGSFKLDQNGFISDSQGNHLQPEFSIPPKTQTTTVEPGGKIVASDSNGKELASTQIQLYNFPNPTGLLSLGSNLYSSSDASGDPIPGNPGVDNYGTISQGSLEMSNVNVVEEMINMINVQRAYELSSKVIQTGDDMLSMTSAMKR
jgi:flagellar basal-body rod protein FlgG